MSCPEEKDGLGTREPTDRLAGPGATRYWGESVQQIINTNTSGWVFRDQPDYEYELVTFLERSLANVPRAVWGDREDSAIDFFRSRASATLDQVPEQDDYLGWLSLMQHYQAPTRLVGIPFRSCLLRFCRSSKSRSS